MAINEIKSTNKGASSIVIRPAVEEDLPLLMALIRELAEYEKLTDILVATEESLKECLFAPNHVAHALIGYCDDEPVGYAFYFYNCSTFLARKGLYLIDVISDAGFQCFRSGTVEVEVDCSFIAVNAQRNGVGMAYSPSG